MRNYFVCTFEVYKVGDEEDDDGGNDDDEGECAEYSHLFSTFLILLFPLGG